MRQLVKWLFRSEFVHFNKLSKTSKKLFNSIFLHNIVAPIFALFITAFIWRQSHDVFLVALYNAVLFTAIPISFYINGHLLKKFYPSQLLFAGVCLKSLGVFGLMLLPTINAFTVITAATFIGLSAGIYWSNRNLLVLKATHSPTRIYFTSLDVISGTILGIIIPIMIGIFIIYGTTAHTYTPIQAYYLVGILTVLVSYWSGYSIRNLSVGLPYNSHVHLNKPSKKWIHSRYTIIIFGLLNGVMAFLPPLIILAFIGKEDALGTIQSLSAIITAIVIYGIARSISPKHRMKLLGASVVLSIIGSIFLLLSSSIGVILFVGMQALAQPLLWVAYNSLISDVMDTENGTANKEYSYMFDFELFMNIGRVTGILLFMYYLTSFSTQFALHYTPLFFCTAQLLLLWIARPIDRKQKVELVPLPQSA